MTGRLRLWEGKMDTAACQGDDEKGFKPSRV
jgi:hypothetical protein